MVKAVVLVGVEPGETDKVFNDIKKNREVKEALEVYGEYDMMFVIEVMSVSEIQSFVKSLRRMKGILRTVTLIEVV